MLQTISNSSEQTIIFSILFFTALLFFLRRKKNQQGFSLEVTASLKGFAILTIIFGHIGYFLFTDHSFLFPLSTISGVGVDLFLLLSGYGLAISALKKNYLPLEFYQKRIGKIFLPLWITLIIFLLLDATILHIFYNWEVIVKSFLGFYPRADIYLDLNSPLWYLTLILFYYIVFPWVFKPKKPFLSAAFLAIISTILVSLTLPVNPGVQHLYQLHFLAFPLGIALAGLSQHWPKVSQHKIFQQIKSPIQSEIIRYISLALLFGILFFSLRPEENQLIYQLLSLLSAISITTIFILTKLRFQLLEVFGNYSYEIYLLHWPLLYRYDFLFRFFPAGPSTAIYLIILLGLAYLLQKIPSNTFNFNKKSP